MQLAQKSAFNIQAAEKLIQNNLFAPSVHCSYYGCFQSMKRVFPEYFKIDYKNLDKLIASGKDNEHSYIIKEISTEIKKHLGATEHTEFNRKIKDLKTFRVKSDYKNEEILVNHAQESLKKSKELIEFLKTYFHV